MTLDHLRITNEAFARILPTLAAGHTPPGTVSIAAVKPSPAVNGTVEAAYEAACDAVLQAVAGIEDLRTATRYAHPWFGPLDGWGWYALAAVHMGLHRTQVERIVEGLE